jgi:hypothetical protein
MYDIKYTLVLNGLVNILTLQFANNLTLPTLKLSDHRYLCRAPTEKEGVYLVSFICFTAP